MIAGSLSSCLHRGQGGDGAQHPGVSSLTQRGVGAWVQRARTQAAGGRGLPGSVLRLGARSGVHIDVAPGALQASGKGAGFAAAR